ncbi:S8 family peptidase [Roseiconus lacunae]|uniref:S8 family peptidase n=1 Tax=Roseiconus lacunae TaxID=2605694 RepID=UPI001E58A48A|nr:S8 family peptidase [Roseiconus lacunae]MCD0459976.1 S8 family peptidase [Roseiconus lacunae]
MFQGEFQGTVLYVHGSGQQPFPSLRKSDWDNTLFGTDMGERTRMVAWSPNSLYLEPGVARQRDSARVSIDERYSLDAFTRSQDSGKLVQKAAGGTPLNENDRHRLISIVDQIRENANAASSGEPDSDDRWARSVSGHLSSLLVHDLVNYYLDVDQQSEIDRSFDRRLIDEDPSYIVVGHGFGGVIAYENLFYLRKKLKNRVKLFVSIGVPWHLLSESVDALQPPWPFEMSFGKLQWPPSVADWIDVSDPQDPLSCNNSALEQLLSLGVECHSRLPAKGGLPLQPNDALRYLSEDFLQERIRQFVGQDYYQEIRNFTLALDVADRIEDSIGEAKQEVLIQIRGNDQQSVHEVESSLLDILGQLVGIEDSNEVMKCFSVDRLKRFVAAELTSSQTEKLGAWFRCGPADGKLDWRSPARIWTDTGRMALIDQSSNTVQARPALKSYGATGEGIGWAVLDTGVRWSHPHFWNLDPSTGDVFGNLRAAWDCTVRGRPPLRSAAWNDGWVNVDFYEQEEIGDDRNGHGTHVAGIIAGADTFDAGARYTAMAPKSQIHSYKVLGDNGRGRDSSVIKALDHIAELNEQSGKLMIHGVNLSLGGSFDPRVYGCGHSPICQELRRLWQMGVVVVIAAGNSGYAELNSKQGTLRANMDLSIGDPANLEEAITVGSVHKFKPSTYGVSFFSSRGPTADGRYKPDLVAPGERIASASNRFDAANAKTHYVEMNGTSMAAPHVSGIIASFLSVRREFIGYPDRIKQILLDSCTDLQRDRYIQGRGMPNLLKMLLNT